MRGNETERGEAAPDPIPYDAALRDRIARHLAAHERRVVDDPTLKHAAVAAVLVDSDVGEDRVDPWSTARVHLDAIPERPHELDGRMVDVSGGAAFLLCRRAAGLRGHARQWALPGGRVDPGESVIEAALRELDEELGVRLGADTVIGLLDDYPTRSGYVVTPVVLWAGGRLDLHPSPAELLAAYRVGLHHLLAPGSPRFVTIPESERPVVQVPLGTDLVHAPTGAVLVQLAWLGLDGRGDSVQGFEQPVFAWR